MKYRHYLFVLVFCFLGFGTLACAAGGAAPATKPVSGVATVDDAQAALVGKDYPGVVKLSSKLLAGRVMAEGDRYRLLTLKAEGLFGTGAAGMAADFEMQAVKETVDPAEIARAKSTAMLFKRAKGTTYVPKVAPAGGVRPGPIDLLDLDKRKEAFSAMLDDDLTALEPRIKSASRSTSLVVIWPVMQQVQDLHSLDLIANGDDSKTIKIAGDLVEHARVLITTALKGMGQRVDDLDRIASQSSVTQHMYARPDGTIVSSSTVHKTGLTNANKDELRDTVGTCEKILLASQAFTPLSKDDKGWAAITSDANRISKRAQDLLNTNYADVTSMNTGLNGQPVVPRTGVTK